VTDEEIATLSVGDVIHRLGALVIDPDTGQASLEPCVEYRVSTRTMDGSRVIATMADAAHSMVMPNRLSADEVHRPADCPLA
jgi:hypothetical protein